MGDPLIPPDVDARLRYLRARQENLRLAVAASPMGVYAYGQYMIGQQCARRTLTEHRLARALARALTGLLDNQRPAVADMLISLDPEERAALGAAGRDLAELVNEVDRRVCPDPKEYS